MTQEEKAKELDINYRKACVEMCKYLGEMWNVEMEDARLVSGNFYVYSSFVIKQKDKDIECFINISDVRYIIKCNVPLKAFLEWCDRNTTLSFMDWHDMYYVE